MVLRWVCCSGELGGLSSRRLAVGNGQWAFGVEDCRGRMLARSGSQEVGLARIRDGEGSLPGNVKISKVLRILGRREVIQGGAGQVGKQGVGCQQATNALENHSQRSRRQRGDREGRRRCGREDERGYDRDRAMGGGNGSATENGCRASSGLLEWEEKAAKGTGGDG